MCVYMCACECVRICWQSHANQPECDQRSKGAGSKPAAGMSGQRRSPAQQSCNTHTQITLNPPGTTWPSALTSRAINVMKLLPCSTSDLHHSGLYSSTLFVKLYVRIWFSKAACLTHDGTSKCVEQCYGNQNKDRERWIRKSMGSQMLNYTFGSQKE